MKKIPCNSINRIAEIQVQTVKHHLCDEDPVGNVCANGFDDDKDGQVDGSDSDNDGDADCSSDDDDGDGIADEDPNGWDTDGDGMPDGWEAANGLNATSPQRRWRKRRP